MLINEDQWSVFLCFLGVNCRESCKETNITIPNFVTCIMKCFMLRFSLTVMNSLLHRKNQQDAINVP